MTEIGRSDGDPWGTDSDPMTDVMRARDSLLAETGREAFSFDLETPRRCEDYYRRRMERDLSEERLLGSPEWTRRLVVGFLVGGPLHGTMMFQHNPSWNWPAVRTLGFDPPLPDWVTEILEWHVDATREVFIGFARRDANANKAIESYKLPLEDLGSYPPRQWSFACVILSRPDGYLYFPRHTGPLAREFPSTHCFDCGSQVPIADVWTKKADPNYALCEGCFRAAETGGRAREGSLA